jgi:hypothetical protein
MARAKKRLAGDSQYTSPQDRLIALIDEATAVAKTARKHHQSLSGANFYANKMADLRADATISFGQLSGKSVGDTTALAELLQRVFSIDAAAKDRAQAARDLEFALKTTWANAPVDQSSLEHRGVFPLVTLNQTQRGYLISVGRQANGCYTAGWYDGCAVMMRRLLESSLIEAFEARKIDAKIKDAATGDFFQLTAIINAAIAEPSWNLPRNVKKQLPNLRDLGHTSAHNRYYLAKKDDIDKFGMAYREAVEAFLHLADLL